jgi:ABC-type Fe3+-hydroxamate transport system substrate-binding protein
VVRHIPKVGGTKDVNLDRIRALAPTHVVVNVDENRREDADALRAFVPHVVVTHPCAPQDNLELYRLLGRTFDREAEAEALCREFGAAFAQTAGRRRPPRDVLYLIWRAPWMSVGPDTYISQTLRAFNWHTVPRASADRYPEVDLAAYAGAVDHVLLSSEPFHFKAPHLDEVAALVPGADVRLIDGEMTSWYGSRAIAGLRYLDRYVTAP